MFRTLRQINNICLSRQLGTSEDNILMEKSISRRDYHQWDPGNIIEAKKGNFSYMCAILNRRILIPAQVGQNIWENAMTRCLVDGGANRWKDFLDTHCRGMIMKPPDCITGDFDSMKEDTSKFFNHPAIKRINTPDQNSTDFTKSIDIMLKMFGKNAIGIQNIVVFHDTSGRLDQIMANINTIFKLQSETTNIYLLSGNSLAWVLLPGNHSIKIPTDLVKHQRWCALIPFGRANCVNTRGLKWNLNNATMQFGELISTSNTYESNCVSVETDSSLLWTMGLFNFEDD